MRRIVRILTALLVLELAFVIHEYGHFREFQKQGIPVEEFSLGIGPKIYHHQSSFEFSIRLLPIMAYVATTKDGGEFFEKQVSMWNQIIVHVAGVRNNFLVGLVGVWFLQVLGWRKGNLSARELFKTAAVTPFKVLFRFFSFLVGCLTWGRVNWAEKFLLSTGGILLPKRVRLFLLLNLTLSLVNMAPIPPMDGGHVVQTLLASSYGSLPSMPPLMSFFLFLSFYLSANKQDMRLFESEREE